MSAKNISIDAAAAQAWIDDVINEIAITKDILNKVATCLQHDPDDDIWFEFERVVKNLTLHWEGLNKAMETACGVMKSAISALWQAAEELIESIKQNAAKLAT